MITMRDVLALSVGIAVLPTIHYVVGVDYDEWVIWLWGGVSAVCIFNLWGRIP